MMLVFSILWLLWVGLKKTIGVRVTPAVEQLRQDVAELGIEAYLEFVLMPEQEGERPRAGTGTSKPPVRRRSANGLCSGGVRPPPAQIVRGFTHDDA